MGIQGLMKLLSEECPGAIKEQEMDNYTGRKIAIDASMAMYQFLVAVRSNGPGGMQASAQLMNDNGDITSHIQGMFNRTIKIMSSGIKPVYVFDGKPPQMKGGELAKRMARRAKAETDLAAAKESGEQDDVDRFSRRLVKVTRQHNEECKELLRLMGVPYVDAPCEAEAQCAELAKKKKVYATATEDMDALTFRTPKLVRKLTFSQGKDKVPIMEIDMESVLIGLELTYEQFVDLCILCGCDYCNSIKGVGPKTALKLIKQHKSLENIIEALRREKKYDIPADWKIQKFSKKALAAAEAAEAAARAEADAKAKARAEEAAAAAASSNILETLNKRSEEALGNAAASVDQPETTTEAEAPAPAPASDTAAAAPADDEVKASGSNQEDDGLVDTDDEAPAGPSVDDEDVPEEEMEGGDVSTSNDRPVDDSNEVVMSELQGDDDEYEIVEPVYVQARKLFLQSEVHDGEKVDLKWSEPNEEGLKKFLVERMGFNAERVSSGIARLKTANQQKSQKRMDSFFSVVAAPTAAGIKRKVEDPKGKPGAKKGPGGAGAKGGAMMKRK